MRGSSQRWENSAGGLVRTHVTFLFQLLLPFLITDFPWLQSSWHWHLTFIAFCPLSISMLQSSQNSTLLLLGSLLFSPPPPPPYIFITLLLLISLKKEKGQSSLYHPSSFSLLYFIFFHFTLKLLV